MNTNSKDQPRKVYKLNGGKVLNPTTTIQTKSPVQKANEKKEEKKEEPKVIARRCNHGPNTYCSNCLDKDINQIKKIEEVRRINNDKTPMTLKPAPKVYKLNGGRVENPQNAIKISAHHNQNGDAIRGVVSAKKDKPMSWMCNHKPNEICSHCARQHIEDRKKEEKRNFDPKKEKLKEKDTVHRLTSMCKHPEEMICINCMTNANKYRYKK